MIILKIITMIIFLVSAFVIIWAMLGYRISLTILRKIFHTEKIKRNYNDKPTVSVMIVAHNEEKVIADKLKNVIDNDYPKEKIEYVVASDFCTDNTNNIVSQFISEHSDIKMTLYCSKEHKGKTNAQNEAQKICKGEILVMTDANAMFRSNSISELVACFVDDNIAYVTGKLCYSNSDDNATASTEALYWEGDLKQREIESNIFTITAGNGAIYAVRNCLYVDFDPIECHDSCMPYYYSKMKKRALYNPDALAFEKAGEIIEDEFKRKVRMNREITKQIVDGIKCLNIFKYGWFSYFYFGHRTCRYLLWLSHSLLLVVSFILALESFGYLSFFVAQVLFYVIAFFGYIFKAKKGLVKLMTYYTMTIIAQWKGVYNCITGKSKPTWSSAKTTR